MYSYMRHTSSLDLDLRAPCGYYLVSISNEFGWLDLLTAS